MNHKMLQEVVIMDLFSVYLSIYGFLAISHILVQMWLGHREYRKQNHPKFLEFHNEHPLFDITVVVPVYNEEPAILRQCLSSIAAQEYAGKMETIIVDDCSKNRDNLKSIYADFEKSHGFKVLLLDKNSGKREAQKAAFDRASGEVLVTIDSDTIIEVPHAIKHITKQFKHPEVGAVTGDVRVENKRDNILTRLISYRYWTAFHQERAAQSLFDVLMCCSGPFSAYRKSIVDKVKNRYVSQYFLGQKCTYGDDRHLTNLVLEEGHKVRFDNKAVAYTQVPNNIKEYLKQQLRWNKSFYREMLWTLRHVTKHHFYMLYDLIVQFILPFMLLIALGAMLYQAVYISTNRLWYYFGVVIIIGLLRSIYGIYRTRDIGFLSFCIYGFIHVFLLIPTRFYALMTLGKSGWGTR